MCEKYEYFQVFFAQNNVQKFASTVMKIHFFPWISLSTVAMLLPLLACKAPSSLANGRENFEVIAYYNGDGSDLESYRWDQLTQVIYSFCHLKGNRLAVDNAADSVVIKRMTALKKKYPHLKVLLSLGGWGGCETCSEVFATETGRKEFSISVRDLLQEYQADGIDLDWEYPAIEGYPGHRYVPEDKLHFSLLVEELRKVLGKNAEISFAAGGFDAFLNRSVDWKRVMPLVNRVNLMSYDLVSGFSKVTGHHTPLYSRPEQEGSVDAGVQALRRLGVPAHKIVIGAAFYARTWVGVTSQDQGLFKAGTFKSFVPFKKFEEVFSKENGFVLLQDTVARAPYAYSAPRQEFATFDDRQSIKAKTLYARQKGLGGIMFWQLGGDLPQGGLLEAIHQAVLKR